MKKIGSMMCMFFLAHCSDSVTSDSQYCPKTSANQSSLAVAPVIHSPKSIHPDGKNITWNIQLTGTFNPNYNVDVYDVDLFETSTSVISSLKTSGKKVICYFSAGSSEIFRPDFDQFNHSDLGKPLDAWPGERWLDVRSINVLRIMEQRMNLAVQKGCNGVDPDNMDGFQQDTCFDLNKNDQLAYNRAIANMAREKGLSVGLKNCPDIASDLVDYFDFSLTEQCYFYNECSKFNSFLLQNKPVMNIEYELSYHTDTNDSAVCDYSNDNDLRTLIMDLALDDSYRLSCF